MIFTKISYGFEILFSNWSGFKGRIEIHNIEFLYCEPTECDSACCIEDKKRKKTKIKKISLKLDHFSPFTIENEAKATFIPSDKVNLRISKEKIHISFSHDAEKTQIGIFYNGKLPINQKFESILKIKVFLWNTYISFQSQHPNIIWNLTSIPYFLRIHKPQIFIRYKQEEFPKVFNKILEGKEKVKIFAGLPHEREGRMYIIASEWFPKRNVITLKADGNQLVTMNLETRIWQLNW